MGEANERSSMIEMQVIPFSIDEILGYRGCRLKGGWEDTKQRGKLNHYMHSSDLNTVRHNNGTRANHESTSDIHMPVDEVIHPKEEIVHSQCYLDAEHVEGHLRQASRLVDNSKTLQPTQPILQGKPKK